jgi:hypothetical protein
VPYLPETAFNDAQRMSDSSDISMAIRMINERWEYAYPALPYYQLDRRVTTSPTLNTLSGETGSTKFDPLWGEAVDPGLTQWQQAHTPVPVTDPVTPPLKAAEVNVYKDPIPIRVQWQRKARDSQLKRWGFDRMRDILAIIPVFSLDQRGITCLADDKIVWDHNEYVVIQQSLEGYWANTNTRLYMVLNCESRRLGS